MRSSESGVPFTSEITRMACLMSTSLIVVVNSVFFD